MIVTKTSLSDDFVQHQISAAIQRIRQNMDAAAVLIEHAWRSAATKAAVLSR